MARILVIYDTKHGNTKLVTEKIIEGKKKVEGTETSIIDVEDVEPEQLTDADAIVIGEPNHFGGPTRIIRKMIDSLGKLNVKAKGIAVFDTYAGGNFEKAVKKMEKRINEKIPGLPLITSGLSIRVDGMKGPIAGGELPKCDDFGKKIANQLNKKS